MSGRQAARGGVLCQLRELGALWDFTVGEENKERCSGTVRVRRRSAALTFTPVPELHLHCYGVLLFLVDLDSL